MTKERTTKFARLKLLLVFPLALSILLVISLGPDVIAQQDEKTPVPPKEIELIEKTADAEPESESEEIVVLIVPRGDEKPDTIFTVAEVMPKFPGGLKALYSYLGENIQYPQKAKEEGISGKVYIQFIVEKDGQPTGFKILRGAEESLDNEALRVLKIMPKWEPGKHAGKPVRVQYNLPIKFTLDEKKAEEK